MATGSRSLLDGTAGKAALGRRSATIEAALWIAENTARVPCLWGPTAVGKTFLVRWLAEQRRSRLITVLLGQSTPDEICGFQVIKDGQLVVGFPWWWREMQEHFEADPQGEVIVFFDEAGQARPETRGVTYTFLRDRTLYGRAPAGRLLVFAATNPARFSAAWRSRICLLHLPPSADYLGDIAAGHWLAEMAVERCQEAAPLENSADPELSAEAPPPPELVDASVVAALRRIDEGFFGLSEEAQGLVLQALLPPAIAETVRRRLAEGGPMMPLLGQPAELTARLAGLDTPAAISLALAVLQAITRSPDDRSAAEALLAILDAFMPDPDKLQAYYGAEKPPGALERIVSLPPELLAQTIIDSGRVRLGGGAISGAWIEALLAQSVSLPGCASGASTNESVLQ
jgi:hypothetical protein